MLLAVAHVLGVNVSIVVLDFASFTFDRRGQQSGVLVSAGVTDFQVSVANYGSRVTQDRLNTEMAAVGLNSGLLVSIAGVFHIQVH